MQGLFDFINLFKAAFDAANEIIYVLKLLRDIHEQTNSKKKDFSSIKKKKTFTHHHHPCTKSLPRRTHSLLSSRST